jgi:hypothetical protein
VLAPAIEGEGQNKFPLTPFPVNVPPIGVPVNVTQLL